MTTPFRPVTSSSGSRPIRIAVAAAATAEVGAQRGAVEVGDHPARDGELRPGSPLASPGAVVDDDDADRRPPPSPASALSAKVQLPRETSAIAPVSEPRGQRRRAAVEVARAARRGCAATGCAVGADDRADVDELLVGGRPGRRRGWAGGCA